MGDEQWMSNTHKAHTRHLPGNWAVVPKEQVSLLNEHSVGANYPKHRDFRPQRRPEEGIGDSAKNGHKPELIA